MKLEMKVDFHPGQRGEFIRVEADKCTACGSCAKFCTRDVWVQEGEVYKPLHLENCVECGACWNVCDFDAVVFEEPKGGTGVRFAYG